MQRILRNTLRARNRRIKAKYDEERRELRNQWREHDTGKVNQNRATTNLIKAERTSRREDWTLGPFAPMRDVGKRLKDYGTLSMISVKGPELPKKYQGPSGNDEPENKEWFGNVGNIAKGDRVVVLVGREKGRIGVVKDISWDRNDVTVEGINMADVQIPESQQPDPRRKMPFVAMEVPYPIHDVKLVHRMWDEETQEHYEAVIDHLRGGAPYVVPEEGANTPRHTRYIQGLDIEIPWPEPEIQDTSRGIYDTPRRDVDDQTGGYVPDLWEPPLPDGVIDTLRSKYDKRRTFHDLEYVQKKVIEDARAIWFEERAKRAISPLVEKQVFGVEDRARRNLEGQVNPDKMSEGERRFKTQRERHLEELSSIIEQTRLQMAQQKQRRIEA